MFDLNLSALALATTTVLVLIFAITLLRRRWGLPLDTIGYQLNLLSMGTLMSIAGAASIGKDFWPNFSASAPMEKGAILAVMMAVQFVALLLTLDLEKRAQIPGDGAIYNASTIFWSLSASSFAMFFIVYASAGWG